MNEYKIESTETTPDIIFNFSNEELLITGVCAPENPLLYFKDLDATLLEYKTRHHRLSIRFRFDYFNTGTSKYVLGLLKSLKAMPEDQFHTEVFWYYDEDDLEMLENGEIFEELSKIKFTYLHN